METEVLKEFLVKLGFNVDESSLGNFNAQILKASAGVMAFGAAITAMAGEIVHQIGEIAEENKQLGLLAQQLNTSAGEVDDFIDTAAMLGISNQVATDSLKSFSRAVEDAGMGIGRSKKVFEKLGIDVKDASGHVRSATDILTELQGKMQGMDRAKQLRVMERLGLDPKMLMMFNDAFGNTKYIGEELSKIDVAAGFNLDKTIAESNKFSKSWKGMTVEMNLTGMLFQKIKEQIATDMMPKIEWALDRITEAVRKMRTAFMEVAPKIEAFIKPLINFILGVADAFFTLAGEAIDLVIDGIGFVMDIFGQLDPVLIKVAELIGGITIAWKVLNAGFLLSPIGIILGLATALLLLYDDYQTAAEGGKSFINWNGAVGQAIVSVVKFLGMAIKMAAGFAVSLINLGAMGFKGIEKLISAGADLIKGWKPVWDWFGKMFDKLSEGFTDLGKKASWFTGLFGGNNSVVLKPSGVGAGSNINQNTVINVNGSADPHTTAKAVSGHQQNVNQNLVRNTTARAR